MRRVLAIALGLLIGLAVAALSDLRLAHLRLVAGGSLPAWTEAADPASGLRQGRIPGATELRWRFAGVGRDGLRWSVASVAPGLRLEATMWLPPQALLPARGGEGAVRLSDVRGRIELGALARDVATLGDGAGGRLEGSLQVTGGEAWLDLRAGAVLGGNASGRIEAARLEGESLGSGPFTVELAAGGGWQMRAALNGGVTPLDAVARGRLARHEVELELTDSENGGEGLPRSWRGSLGVGEDGPTSQAVRLVHLGE